MYTLFLVDDEPTVRHGLRTYVDWNAYGIEIAGEAEDGDEALELIDAIKPDLVLTDVRMPNMDGITLSRIIRERMPRTKIVFVSGYDDAEYMKSALKLDAVDYIFKPVNLEELQLVIERVVGELSAERSQRKLMNDMSVRLKESMPLLREKFLMLLIRDGISRTERMQERLEFLELRLPESDAYWAIVVQVDDNAELVEGRTERDNQLISYAVQNVCQELADRHMAGYAFENRSGEYVVIVHMGESVERDDRLYPLVEDIRENLQLWLKLSVTIGVGGQAAGPPELPQSYAQARDALAQKWYMGKNRIITMDSLDHGQAGFHRLHTTGSEAVESVIRAGAAEQLPEVLDGLFAELARNRSSEGLQYCRIVCLQLLLTANRLLVELNVHAEESPTGKDAELWERVYRLETAFELKLQLEAHLQHICKRIHEKRSRKSSNVVERVRGILEQRYAENLTMADIAKELYLTSTYVCLLFKQETGETVNEALTKVRIGKAKELLKDPKNKFYDVCYAVGYADPSYFTKLFKKYTGVTPSSFRP